MATKKRYVDDGDQPTINSVIGGNDPDAIGAPVDDGDQPTVNSVIYGDDPDTIGGATAIPSTSPGGGGQTTTDIVEEIVEEEVPYIRPDYGRVCAPSFGAVGGIDIEDAPAYEKSPEQIAWEEAHGGRIEDILKTGGYGIDKDTQQLMKQQIYDDLKAREKESIRIMERDLEQRGVYDSNLYISEKQKIKATTSRGLAAATTEIKIKSAFIKMASFENALGLSAQFLGYLGKQSELANAPGLATWQMRAQAKIVEYQARVDIYKAKLQCACATNNMREAAEIAADAAYQQNIWDTERLEMEMEYAQETAKAQSSGNILGNVLMALLFWWL